MADVAPIHERGELLRRIFDAVPGGIVHVAKDGAIVTANADALRILGFKYDDVTKRYISDWAAETIRDDGTPCPVTDYPVAKVLATGEPQGPDTIGFRRPNGELSWAVFRAVPLHDAAGELEGAIVTFLDITERKRAEERWRLLAENLPDFVVLMDAEARILWVNHVRDGVSLESVIGSFGYAWVDESDRETWVKSFEGVLANGRATRFEVAARHPDAAMFWYETILAPVASGGRVERVLAVARDVTERRAMLATLAKRERLASVGMVAASVAHEIMNPLQYVLANLEFASGERLGEERRARCIVEAREGAKRMQQIVWDLRALARAGSEELFYVDARTVLETALRLAATELSRAARVVLELDEVPSVLASESRLCQVFINLLVNAAQAVSEAPAAAREIRVRARYDEAAALVAIDIADNGVGIASDRLERIFEPFYTTKDAGTGLGLSISREIVERMGGRIAVDSAPGRGSTFTVWLPTTRKTSSADALAAGERAST